MRTYRGTFFKLAKKLDPFLLRDVAKKRRKTKMLCCVWLKTSFTLDYWKVLPCKWDQFWSIWWLIFSMILSIHISLFIFRYFKLIRILMWIITLPLFEQLVENCWMELEHLFWNYNRNLATQFQFSIVSIFQKKTANVIILPYFSMVIPMS